MPRCEICDREIKRPHQVPHEPHAVRAIFERGFDAMKDVDYGALLLYSVTTCGDAICIFRARANGVPGATYRTGLEVAA